LDEDRFFQKLPKKVSIMIEYDRMKLKSGEKCGKKETFKCFFSLGSKVIGF